MIVFQTSDAQRATLAPNLVRWRENLVLAHAATLPLALALTILAYAPSRAWVARRLGPTVALGYLVHGAVIAGIDQLSLPNVTVFIGYSLGIAVVVCFTPLEGLLVYSLGLATYVAALTAMQPSATARQMLMPTGFTTAIVSVTMIVLLFGARRREFAQRVTIDKQRDALAEMNAGLEQRVREQVSEIVERAREIEQLNAQLQAQVRARSMELSMALAKLARDRNVDGRLRKGVVLGDRFVIDELIGEGGMGSVYSGSDRSSGGRVAIKVIQAGSTQQLDALHRFLREAGTAATVVHPAVVRMLHVDVSADGMLFQVQELVLGETLHQRLKRSAPWDPARVARFGAVLCDALAAAHAVGVVHRDVKPGNMMLTTTAPGLKLLDFGISKLFRGAADSSSGSGKVLGTPAYMAPENLDGSGSPTDRADVYAVGVILFRMLTGELPFDEASTREIILRHAVEPAPDVRDLATSVPPAMAALVGRSLAKAPPDRPSARELAEALGALADAENAPPLDAIAREAASEPPERSDREMATIPARRRMPIA
jgi:serine/threonine-protein kinase